MADRIRSKWFGKIRDNCHPRLAVSDVQRTQKEKNQLGVEKVLNAMQRSQTCSSPSMASSETRGLLCVGRAHLSGKSRSQANSQNIGCHVYGTQDAASISSDMWVEHLEETYNVSRACPSQFSGGAGSDGPRMDLRHDDDFVVVCCLAEANCPANDSKGDRRVTQQPTLAR